MRILVRDEAPADFGGGAIGHWLRVVGLEPAALDRITQLFTGVGGWVANGPAGLDLVGDLGRLDRLAAVLTAEGETAGRELQATLQRYRSPAPIWHVGERELDLREALVMGILNVTPDSFSDGGRYEEITDAAARTAEMLATGADIIDIGGESTRPGFQPVSAEEELRRVRPVIQAIAGENGPVISVDTTKVAVAEAALAAGAVILNDIWGLRQEPDLARVAAAHGAGLVLMHNRVEVLVDGDILADIIGFLADAVELALRAGLEPDHLAVDPGFGFGKTLEQNLEVLRRLPELKVLGLPILVGTSRKSLIGRTLNLPVSDRLEGTAATVALAVAGGAKILRVHDVEPMRRVIRMTEAVLRG